MLEDIGDVDTKSTFLPWQNMAARVKLFNLQGRIPYAHGEKTPTPSFYPSLVRKTPRPLPPGTSHQRRKKTFLGM